MYSTPYLVLLVYNTPWYLVLLRVYALVVYMYKYMRRITYTGIIYRISKSKRKKKKTTPRIFFETQRAGHTKTKLKNEEKSITREYVFHSRDNRNNAIPSTGGLFLHQWSVPSFWLFQERGVVFSFSLCSCSLRHSFVTGVDSQLALTGVCIVFAVGWTNK